MFGHHQGGYARRPQYYDAPYGREPELLGREQERMLAQLLRQRHGGGGLMSGHTPGLGSMGGHQQPFLGRHGMSPMMGDYPHHSLLPQMGMNPGIGMGMGLGMGSGMGMGLSIGMSPHMGMRPPIGMSQHSGVGLGMGMGGQPPYGHSPYGRRRHSPFGYDSPGPPRAHSFLPQQRHAYSPFPGLRHNPLPSSGSMFGGDEDYDDMYRTPSRHHFGRPMRSQSFDFPPQRRSRRRGYQRSMCGELEDEYDGYDDYDDDYDEEDIFEGYFSGHSPHMRLRY